MKKEGGGGKGGKECALGPSDGLGGRRKGVPGLYSSVGPLWSRQPGDAQQQAGSSPSLTRSSAQCVVSISRTAALTALPTAS